jgi:hypothetical protein
LPLPEYQPSVSPVTPPPSPPRDASRPWIPGWQQIAVSFVLGAVIALLLSLQLRELRKRRQQQDAEPASKG